MATTFLARTVGVPDPDPAPRPEVPLTDEQRLAASVLRMAVVDATATPGHRADPEDIADARQFLAGDDGRLQWWCAIANLSPELVRQLAQRVLAQKRERGQRVGNPKGLRAP